MARNRRRNVLRWIGAGVTLVCEIEAMKAGSSLGIIELFEPSVVLRHHTVSRTY